MAIDQFQAGETLMRAPRGYVRSAALGSACLLALSVGATAQDSSSLHDKLAAWVGHWKNHIETKETQFGHAKSADFDAKCSFLSHGAFVVCEYLSLQPDPDTGQIINDVSLIYYSEIDKTFKITNVAAEGGSHENLMSVAGNIWTRPFEIARRGGRCSHNLRFRLP
jgi:hypothetical protein